MQPHIGRHLLIRKDVETGEEKVVFKGSHGPVLMRRWVMTSKGDPRYHFYMVHKKEYNK